MQIRGAKNICEVEKAYELAAKIFGPNYFESKGALAHFRSLEPTERLQDMVLVVEGVNVMGFVRVLDRRFYSPVGVIDAGGITSVCIHPQLRGQGWGIRVMESALQRSRERGDAFSALFARRAVDGWYPKLGYVGIGCHVDLRIDTSDRRNTLTTSSLKVQPGMVQSWTEVYSAAYAESYEGLFLAFFRDADWWSDLESRLAGNIEKDDFSTVLDGATPIGYYVRMDGAIVEAAALPQYRIEFVECLLEDQSTNHPGPLVSRLPADHWCVQILRGINHTLSVRCSWDGGHMVRILDKETFKDMTNHFAGAESDEIIDKTFGKLDMTRHQDALRLLSTLAGAQPIDLEPTSDTGEDVPGKPLLPTLPAWSMIDEL